MAFKNQQWTVTNYGLEAIKPAIRYEIEASRLAETTTRLNGTFYDWPLHLSEKSWVDLNAFHEAFVEALKHHKGRYSAEIDQEMLEASIAEAWRLRREG